MPGERALERRVVTVVFADLAGFTGLGDTLESLGDTAVGDEAVPVEHSLGIRQGR